MKIMTEFGEAHTGVWLDGAGGWLNQYRVIDLAMGYGMQLSDEDTRLISDYRGESFTLILTIDVAECIGGLADKATEYLQELCAPGYVLTWDAGELSLWALCQTGDYDERHEVCEHCMPQHADYPHEPGRLYDCPRCEHECHCSHLPGETECVFCALLRERHQTQDV